MTHNKPDIIQSDNEKEFKQFLAKLNIQQIFGMPYNSKSQGAVESFNKTIQKFKNQLNITKKEVLPRRLIKLFPLLL